MVGIFMKGANVSSRKTVLGDVRILVKEDQD